MPKRTDNTQKAVKAPARMSKAYGFVGYFLHYDILKKAPPTYTGTDPNINGVFRRDTIQQEHIDCSEEKRI